MGQAEAEWQYTDAKGRTRTVTLKMDVPSEYRNTAVQVDSSNYKSNSRVAPGAATIPVPTVQPRVAVPQVAAPQAAPVVPQPYLPQVAPSPTSAPYQYHYSDSTSVQQDLDRRIRAAKYGLEAVKTPEEKLKDLRRQNPTGYRDALRIEADTNRLEKELGIR